MADSAEYRLLDKSELTVEEISQISLERCQEEINRRYFKAVRDRKGCDSCSFGQRGIQSKCNVDGICDVEHNRSTLNIADVCDRLDVILQKLNS